jgi:hypothetical protein
VPLSGDTTRMYIRLNDIVTPNDETPIWRYLDLPKLLALCQSSQLYLCRLDRLRDPWEGQLPPAVLDAVVSRLASVPSDGSTDFRALLSQFSRDFATSCFVSCWHDSPFESAALWDQYGHSRGLAIRSTIGRLKEACRSEHNYFIGRVQYADYSGPFLGGKPSLAGPLAPAFMKRKSFEHEHEIRVLVNDMPLSVAIPYSGQGSTHTVDWTLAKESHHLEVNLPRLIESVFISPESPAWLLEPVREFLRRFGLEHASVQRSDLYDKTVR